MDGFSKRRETEHRLDLAVARAQAIWSRCEPRKIPSAKVLMSGKTSKPSAADTKANALAWITVIKGMNGKGEA